MSATSTPTPPIPDDMVATHEEAAPMIDEEHEAADAPRDDADGVRDDADAVRDAADAARDAGGTLSAVVVEGAMEG